MRREIKRKGNNEKGFTLLEMMIVVAIIAVLVVISIPVFTGVLEKSREATDLANVRSAYAEVMIAAITQDTTSSLYNSSLSQYRKDVKLAQKIKGWDTDTDSLNIGGVSANNTDQWIGEPNKNGKCAVIYDSLQDKVSLVWSGYVVEINNQWGNVDGKVGLINRNYNEQWPASAVNDFIEADVGQKVVTKKITESEFPNLYKHISSGGGYEIGISIIDENDQELADTGGIYIGTDQKTFTISSTSGDFKASGGKTPALNSNTNIKLAIQFFKMNSGTNHGAASTVMTKAEAEELERIFEITD